MSLRLTLGALAAGLVAAALPACGATPVRDEPVVLRDVRGAWVVSGGTRRPAAEGDTLTKRDLVRTDQDGTVTLVVRNRRVVLGGSTDVVVPDGATVDLAKGAVLVDRREGPGLTLHARDTTIDDIGQGALRVERSLSVHIAGLSAGARIRTVTGQRLDLAPLYQVGVPGRSLPRTALPLQLRRDAWERAVIADVLADDERLTDLARGIDAPGPPVVPAAYRSVAAARPSDVLLADAIGHAAARDDGARRAAVLRARALRAEGGSWGVVARLLDTTAVAAGSALAELLRGDTPPVAAGPQPGAPRPTDGAPVAGGSPRPGGRPSPSPSPTRTSGPTERPTTRPPSSPPTESESPDPLEELISSIPTTPPPVRVTVSLGAG